MEIDLNFLRKLFHESRMDTINVEYEWFNYTLAQFWHTYSDWIDEYVRMQIEQAVGSMKFLKLEECTLGKVGLANARTLNLVISMLATFRFDYVYINTEKYVKQQNPSYSFSRSS